MACNAVYKLLAHRYAKDAYKYLTAKDGSKSIVIKEFHVHYHSLLLQNYQRKIGTATSSLISDANGCGPKPPNI